MEERSRMEQIAPGLLIAAPMLRDPNFERTVVLMCIMSDDGAMGLVINREAPLNMRDILTQLGLSCVGEGAQPLMLGGPVAQDSGLLLYRVDPAATGRDDELTVTEDLRLCPNRDLLKEIGEGQGPAQYHMFLGHAGWGPGQLENELAHGAWIPASLRLDLIFSVPIEERWDEALRGEGIHPAGFGGRRPSA
jgi:putative transcriptional regulator